MAVDLAFAAVLYAIGFSIFGHFERYARLRKRIAKLVLTFGSTALVSSVVGHWSLVFVVCLFALGIAVHFWWTIRHGIHPITAEPKAKYYALRGWTLEGA